MNVMIKLPEPAYDYIRFNGKLGWITDNELAEAIRDGIPVPNDTRLFKENDIINGNYQIIGHRIYGLEPVIDTTEKGTKT